MYNNHLIAFINKGLLHSTAINIAILQLTSVCLFFPLEAIKLQNRWEKLCRNDRQASDVWLRWWRWILTTPQGLIALSASSILGRKHFFRISWKAERKLVSLSCSRAPVGEDRYYYL